MQFQSAPVASPCQQLQVRAWGAMAKPLPAFGADSAGLRAAARAVPSAVREPKPWNAVVAIDTSGHNAYALLRNGTLIGWGPHYPEGGSAVASGLLSFKVCAHGVRVMCFLVQSGSNSPCVHGSAVRCMAHANLTLPSWFAAQLQLGGPWGYELERLVSVKRDGSVWEVRQVPNSQTLPTWGNSMQIAPPGTMV